MHARHTCAPPVYDALAYHPLFGAPPDPRLLEAFGSQRAAFDKAAALLEPAGEALEIDFEGARLPAYLFRAAKGSAVRFSSRQRIRLTIYKMFLGQAVPALRRGYHCLVFDGPGQGAVLFEQGIPIRADWEAVLSAVVDAIVGREEIDPDRIALTGWSLGGYLALRAASGEPRLAACIADPALLSMGAGMIGRLRAIGISDSVIERYPDIDDATLAPLAEAIHGDRAKRWAVEQRAFWVHGVSTLASTSKPPSRSPWRDGSTASAAPPPTAAEADPLARSADQVYEGLTGPKTLLRFTAAEGRRRPLRDAQPHPARPTGVRLARRGALSPSFLAIAPPAGAPHPLPACSTSRLTYGAVPRAPAARARAGSGWPCRRIICLRRSRLLSGSK